jgi:phenylacetate-CoA ligase
MPTLYYWPEGGIPPEGLARTKVRVDRALRREVYLDPLHQDDGSLRRVVSCVRATHPHLVVGFTQALVLLARFVEDRRLRDWDDIPVVTGAEGLLPGDRSALARAFGPSIFETYGARETMLIAAECCAHDGLHLAEENLVVELVDADGSSSVAGEPGDVVVTDLHNYGMPLIRYVNGDVAVMAEERICACGRGLRKLARVHGRRADTLRDRQGVAIPGIMFHALFATKEEIVRQFQAVQRATGEVTLRIVRGQDWAEPAFETIVARLRGYLSGLPLSVEFVERIEPSPSGKLRTIIAETA